MSYSLGIDFGTSTTKVALRRENEIPQPLPIGNRGEYFMPSVVAYRKRQNDEADIIAVGEDAVAMSESEDIHIVSEIKRCLTATESELKLPSDRFPWWNHEDRCIELWSKQYHPLDVILKILTEALERAVSRARELGFGDKISSFSIRSLPTRIGTSVTSGLETRKVLAEVTRRLGFDTFRVENLVEESVLACLSYVHLDPEAIPGKTILVYDLGGGTFDTAIIKVDKASERSGPSLTIFSTDGEPFTGGVDIDERLFRYISERIAKEKLGFKDEEQAEILKLLNADEKQKLWNQAREAKEILSTNDEARIVMPPGWLGKSDVELTISRNELETIIEATGLVDKTLECVLRCWRRARMLLRNQDETIATFHLQYDRSSGKIGGSVLKLDHKDLNTFVDNILIVGGTTRIPLIRRRLASLWGEDKFIPEGEVVKPIEACSIGAAWQQESVNAIVDRLPFSINISWESGGSNLYQAFEPTTMYKTMVQKPEIISFKNSVNIPAECKEISIAIETPDGDIQPIELLQNIQPGKCEIEIDLFGRCLLRDGQGAIHELPNTKQHQLQKALWERFDLEKKQEKKRQDEEDKQRTRKFLYRKPGEDLHEVG